MSTVSPRVQIEGLWEEVITSSHQFVGKRVRITVLPETERTISHTPSKIGEHDVIRVRRDLHAEGYTLQAGMIGAVVSVYGGGAAFAVEFPNLDAGPAVVTLKCDDLEKVDTNG